MGPAAPGQDAAAPRPSGGVRLALLLLLAGVAGGYLASLQGLPLIRAEALYAVGALEMLRAGEWLTPTFQGLPYLDKPPLIFWLNALLAAAAGEAALTARLLNLGLALGEVWLTYCLGSRLFGPRPAWWGAFALAVSVGFFVLHLQLLTDHLITFWLLAAFCLWLRWLAAPGRLLELAFFACLGAGFLSKGLIGVCFPLAILGLTAWAGHARNGLVLLGSARGWALLAGLLLPWLLLMEFKHPGFVRHQLVNEQLLRFFGQRQPPDVTSFSVGGFWLLTALWLLPWTPLLPAAFRNFWREAAGPGAPLPLGRLLFLWPAVILGFFSLSACRVEYYPLPSLPPLALLAGWQLERSLRVPGNGALPVAMSVLAGAAVLPFVLLHPLEHLLAANRREFCGLTEALAPQLAPGLGILAAWGLVGGLWGWRRPRLALAAYAGLAFTLLALSLQGVRALSPRLSDHLPGAWLRQHAQPGEMVVMETVEEYEYAASLVFYAGRPVKIIIRRGLPQFPRPVTAPDTYLISPAELLALWDGAARVYLLVDEAAEPAEPWQGAPPLLVTPGKRLYRNFPPLPCRSP